MRATGWLKDRERGRENGRRHKNKRAQPFCLFMNGSFVRTGRGQRTCDWRKHRRPLDARANAILSAVRYREPLCWTNPFSVTLLCREKEKETEKASSSAASASISILLVWHSFRYDELLILLISAPFFYITHYTFFYCLSVLCALALASPCRECPSRAPRAFNEDSRGGALQGLPSCLLLSLQAPLSELLWCPPLLSRTTL